MFFWGRKLKPLLTNRFFFLWYDPMNWSFDCGSRESVISGNLGSSRRASLLFLIFEAQLLSKKLKMRVDLILFPVVPANSSTGN